MCGGRLFKPWDKDSAMVPAMLAAEAIGRTSVAGLGLTPQQALRYGAPSGEEVQALRDAAIPYLNDQWPGSARYSAELRLLGVVTKMVLRRRAAIERDIAKAQEPEIRKAALEELAQQPKVVDVVDDVDNAEPS